MRRLRLALGLAAALLLWAAPGYGAETLTMTCPVCDHVDVSGAGLEPNARLTLVIRDVRTGQKVIPDMPVVASASGEFEREIDLDLSKYPALLADLYEKNGSTLVLAAHTNAEAPATASVTWRSPTRAPAPGRPPRSGPACWSLAACSCWPAAAVRGSRYGHGGHSEADRPRGLAVFVQVIQGQVADAEQVRAALDRWARELAPAPPAGSARPPA